MMYLLCDPSVRACGAFVPWHRHKVDIVHNTYDNSEIRENRVERLKQSELSTTSSRDNTRGERGVRGCMNVGRKKTVVRER